MPRAAANRCPWHTFPHWDHKAHHRSRSVFYHITDQVQHFLMGIDIRFTFIFTVVHELAYHPDYLGDTQKMINMLMRHKDMPHIHPVISGVLKLMEDCTTASAVNHKILFIIFYHKTGVIALRNKRISCSKHC